MISVGIIGFGRIGAEHAGWLAVADGIRAVAAGQDPWGTHWPDGKVIPTHTQDLVLRIPPAPTPEADRRLVRETGRRAVTG